MVSLAFSIDLTDVTVKWIMTVTASKLTPGLPLAIAGCAAVAVGFGFARYGFGLFISAFRTEFGLTTPTIGAIGSAASAMYLVSLLTCGALTARWGPRLPVLVANLAAVAGLGLMACAVTAPMLIAGVVIAAASSGMGWGPFADAVGEHVSPRRQNRTLSIISSGTAFGMVIAGALALWTADRAGTTWRLIWLVFTLLATVVTVLAYVVMADATEPARRHRTRYRPTSASAPLYGLSALYGAAGAVFFTFAVDLVRGEGLSPRWSSLLWLLVGLGGIGGVETATVVNHLGLGRSLQFGVVLLAASIAVLAAVPSNAGLTGLAALVFGTAYMPVAALLTIWNQRLAPRHPTSGLVFTLCSLGTGSVIGPAAVGVVADAHGLRPAFVLTAAVLAAGGLPLCRRATAKPTSPRPGNERI